MSAPHWHGIATRHGLIELAQSSTGRCHIPRNNGTTICDVNLIDGRTIWADPTSPDRPTICATCTAKQAATWARNQQLEAETRFPTIWHPHHGTGRSLTRYGDTTVAEFKGRVQHVPTAELTYCTPWAGLTVGDAKHAWNGQ